MTKDTTSPWGREEDLARAFHEAYERLAPSFGYETREASAKPWSEVPQNNRALMIAVCGELLSRPFAPPEGMVVVPRTKLEALADEWDACDFGRYGDKYDRGREQGKSDCADDLRAMLSTIEGGEEGQRASSAAEHVQSADADGHKGTAASSGHVDLMEALRRSIEADQPPPIPSPALALQQSEGCDCGAECMDLGAQGGCRYVAAALGRACEANGLAGYGDDGEMWFQPLLSSGALSPQSEAKPSTGTLPTDAPNPSPPSETETVGPSERGEDRG